MADTKQQAPDLPVYLFTGFLEAGKTKFIQETLEDSRFHKGERTLLLLCEEGEEVYEPDKFCAGNVYVRNIDEESDLTVEHLKALQDEIQPERVLVEFNGMWMLDSLYGNLPEGWAVAQEFLFCDATSFLSYNANMRQLMVDKLKSAELVVLNRYNDSMDRMEMHRIIRAISRRCDIAYEYTDGKVVYDDIEDPLKGTAPHMTIEENLAVAYLRSSDRHVLFGRVSRRDRDFFRDALAQLDMGLEDRMNTPVGLLSGGQRQALTLLMATMVTPELLLLDEHTAALDPVTADKVLALTRSVVSERSISCLMITHNMHQALELGTRTLMMDAGRIVLDVSGPERAGMTVQGLLDAFAAKAGEAFDNDRVLLSTAEDKEN